jgi:hypothetical protein
MGQEDTDYGDFQAGGDPLGPDEAARYALGQQRLTLAAVLGCFGVAVLLPVALVAAVVYTLR